MTMVEFTGKVRWWDPAKQSGLAVVDIPEHLVEELGGRRQARVTGKLGDTDFSGSTMLVQGGGLCVGVSKAALASAGAGVGDEVQLSLARATAPR